MFVDRYPILLGFSRRVFLLFICVIISCILPHVEFDKNNLKSHVLSN